MKAPRGFTLAELLVSIGIMVLFLAILLPGFSSFGRRNELAQAAQLVQSKILETKTYALAPRATGGALLPIMRYVFGVIDNPTPGCSSPGPGTYGIIEQSAADTGKNGTLVECAPLPSGVVFSQYSVVTFLVEQQGAVMQAQSVPEICYVIQHTRLTTNNQRYIVVRTATGQITINSNAC